MSRCNNHHLDPSARVAGSPVLQLMTPDPVDPVDHPNHRLYWAKLLFIANNICEISFSEHSMLQMSKHYIAYFCCFQTNCNTDHLFMMFELFCRQYSTWRPDLQTHTKSQICKYQHILSTSVLNTFENTQFCIF